MKLNKTRLFITCEHGGNEIPAAYHPLFQEAEAVLASHRGYDLGALAIAETLKPLADFYQVTKVSRLFIELNRSLHHPRLWSEFTNALSSEQKQAILAQYYFPYRQKVEVAIAAAIAEGYQVLHIAVHSFTPTLNEEIRQAEIGLLFDPKRPSEKQFCTAWQQTLKQLKPNWRIRKNYPYLGTADGFPTYLRKQFSPEQYAGVELEMNQGLLQVAGEEVGRVILESLDEIY